MCNMEWIQFVCEFNWDRNKNNLSDLSLGIVASKMLDFEAVFIFFYF